MAGARAANATGVIAFADFAPTGTRLMVVAADHGEPRVLFRLGSDGDPAWSPDGRRLAFVSTARGGSIQGLFVYEMSTRRISELTRHRSSSGIFDVDPEWSHNGKRIIFGRQMRDAGSVFVINANGTGERRVLRNGYGPAWSPDGTRIAFVRRNARDGDADIYVASAEGAALRRLTRSRSDDFDPEWSPNGKEIAFTSHRDGNFEIYTMGPDGGNERRLTHLRVDDVNPTWSPDGQWIAFASRRFLGRLDIFVMRFDGSQQRAVTRLPYDDAAPAWRPTRSRP